MDGPVFFQLLGYPGSGKYTVGREIVRQMEEAGRTTRLVDNHSISNPIFNVVPRPGRDGIPERVIERIGEVATAVAGALAEWAPLDWSFVFTNFVPAARGRPDSFVSRRTLAADRGAAFVPVLLECHPDELLRRVPRPDRTERLKLDDPGVAARVIEHGVFEPDWPDLRRLDVTSLAPADAAARIIGFAGSND